MKKIVETHKTELEKFTDYDTEDLMSITYLHEFDRKIQ